MQLQNVESLWEKMRNLDGIYFSDVVDADVDTFQIQIS